MKKIFLSMMALAIAMNAFAYDLAEKDTIYYGSGCAAIGLADGTVGVYRARLQKRRTTKILGPIGRLSIQTIT